MFRLINLVKIICVVFIILICISFYFWDFIVSNWFFFDIIRYEYFCCYLILIEYFFFMKILKVGVINFECFKINYKKLLYIVNKVVWGVMFV